MKYREIELKYRADDIPLPDFVAFCQARQPVSTYAASGFDRFYENVMNSDCFCRHRAEPGKFNQLTFKRKTSDRNNYIRSEHNITLGLEVTAEQVEALCKEFSFEYNTSIFKNCFIYKYDVYTLVYYICYDTSMTELGRFMEIEMDEDHPWKSDEEAWTALTALEAECRPLGVSAQARVRRSLFEMFRVEK